MAQKFFKANIVQIDKLRVARGWSREDLASKAIVSTRTLDSLMAKGNGTLSTFAKIAKAFGLPPKGVEVPIESIIEGYEAPQALKERIWTVSITISTPFDEFDESKDLPRLLKFLLDRMGGPDLTAPTDIRPGSTKIDLEMDLKQVVIFVSGFVRGNYDDLEIVSISAPWPFDPKVGESYIDGDKDRWEPYVKELEQKMAERQRKE